MGFAQTLLQCWRCEILLDRLVIHHTIGKGVRIWFTMCNVLTNKRTQFICTYASQLHAYDNRSCSAAVSVTDDRANNNSIFIRYAQTSVPVCARSYVRHTETCRLPRITFATIWKWANMYSVCFIARAQLVVLSCADINYVANAVYATCFRGVARFVTEPPDWATRLRPPNDI